MPRSHQGVLCSACTWHLSLHLKASCMGFYCLWDYPLLMQTRNPHTKDRSTVCEGPIATDPWGVRVVLDSFPMGRRLFPMSVQQTVTWALPQSCPHSQPTRPQGNHSFSLCLDSSLCPVQEAQRMFFYALHCLLHRFSTPTISKHFSHFSGVSSRIDQCRQRSSDRPRVQMVRTHVLTWT